MSEESLVAVYTTNDVAKAEIIKAALEGEGIRCEIENEHQAALTGVTNVRLFVLEHDADRAEDFIAAHEAGHAESDLEDSDG